jgi:hypothetical protein
MARQEEAAVAHVSPPFFTKQLGFARCPAPPSCWREPATGSGPILMPTTATLPRWPQHQQAAKHKQAAAIKPTTFKRKRLVGLTAAAVATLVASGEEAGAVERRGPDHPRGSAFGEVAELQPPRLSSKRRNSSGSCSH